MAVLSLCNKHKSCHISWSALRRHTAGNQITNSPIVTKSPLDLWRKNPRLIGSYYRSDRTENVPFNALVHTDVSIEPVRQKFRRVISSTRNANVSISIHAELLMRCDCAHAIGRDESHQKQKNLSLSSTHTHTHTHTPHTHTHKPKPSGKCIFTVARQTATVRSKHALPPTQHSKTPSPVHIASPGFTPCNTDRYLPTPSRHNRFLPYRVQFFTERCTGSYWQYQQWLDIIWYNCLLQLGWHPVAVLQYSTHLHTNNTENNTMKQNT
jgi:hypothetical protein